MLGKRQDVAASLVLDLDVALLDVDVRGPVLAHRPELDQMARWDVLTQGEQEVERPDNVVHLGLDRVATGDHRVRSRGLLGVVHDGLGEEVGDHALEERRILGIADMSGYLPPGDLAPGVDPIRERFDRRERVGRSFQVPATAGEAVDHGHLVVAS